MWAKEAHMKSLRSQKMLVSSHPLLEQVCPAQLRRPGRTLGFPWGSAGKVTEERQPSSKAFRFGTYNSTVLLEKIATFPQSDLVNDQFWQCWRGREPSWARRNLPQTRPRAMEHQGTSGLRWQDPTASLARQGQHCAGMSLRSFSLT